ncbi:MAG TPA: hypothetical protein VF718_10800 [Allosphingosinicella sp.]|jgi:hypothetical protein
MALPEYSFRAAQASAVAASDKALRITDRAGSIWRRAASKPAHAARLRSLDRFLPDGLASSADGGWWELEPGVQIVTPAMFGCGPSVADNAPGLSDFYAYLERFGCAASHDGLYPVRSQVVMGTGAAEAGPGGSDRALILGRLTLDVTAPIAGAVVTSRMKRSARIEGMAIGGGGGSLAYADKLFDIGLLVEGSARRQTIGHLEVGHARLFGVFLRGRGAGSAAFGHAFGTARIHGCGSGCADSGSRPAPAGAFLRADYSMIVPGGASGAFYQTSTFQLKPGSALPPPAIEAYGLPSFVRVGGEEFPVVFYDRSANRVTVWGWAPPGTASTDGSIDFVFGGGWASAGGDSGTRVGHLALTANAIGHQNGALHPAAVAATMKHNYIGQTVGSSPTGASVGGATFGRFEGNNADIWFLASPESKDVDYRVVADRAPGPARVRFHSGRRSDGSKVHSGSPRGLTLSYRRGTAALPSGPEWSATGTSARPSNGAEREARRSQPI